MSLKYWWLSNGDREIVGIGGERVTLHINRLDPCRERTAIMDALNALPEYQAAAESPTPLHSDIVDTFGHFKGTIPTTVDD